MTWRCQYLRRTRKAKPHHADPCRGTPPWQRCHSLVKQLQAKAPKQRSTEVISCKAGSCAHSGTPSSTSARPPLPHSTHKLPRTMHESHRPVGARSQRPGVSELGPKGAENHAAAVSLPRNLSPANVPLLAQVPENEHRLILLLKRGWRCQPSEDREGPVLITCPYSGFTTRFNHMYDVKAERQQD